MYDVIIVGAGFAGSTIAAKAASDNKKVLVIDARDHIGGNAYDFIDENNVMFHQYGPHIFHTNSKEVVDFLSNYTDWYPYTHRVLGYVKDKLVPIPFNLTSIEEIFDDETAKHLKDVLINEYGEGSKVPILKLKENNDPEIKKLADFIFENVFKYYTMKQWGLTVEEIDPNVTARVPINVSYDDRYFNDTYQQMPKEGYTKIFERMLNNSNIEVRLNTKAKDVLKLDFESGKVFFDNKEFTGKLIYTGAVDDLCDYKFGDLPYRSLEFDVQTKSETYQPVTTVNYPTPEDVNAYTRITEFKQMMEKYPEDKTTIAIEYPHAYDKDGEVGNIPYYPIFTEDNQKKYETYCKHLEVFKNLYLLGRLAEYKYYNMDAIILKALELYKTIK